MKICQINCVYGEGSTGKIVRDIHNCLMSENVKSIVIVPMVSRTFSDDKGVFAVSNKYLSMLSAFWRRVTGRQFDGAYFQTNRILRILKTEKPDIVHLHCINGNNINVYRLYEYLAKNKIKTVLSLHAEFPYTGGCGHAYDCTKWKSGCYHCPILKEATQSFVFDGTKHTWARLKECYQLFDDRLLYITAVSPWLVMRARQSPMLYRFNMTTVMNGVDTRVFRRYKKTNWRETLGIKNGEKILFHVTANFCPNTDSLKGGKYILEIAKQLKFYNLKIVVAANYAKIGNLPANVIFIGRTKNQQMLAELYSEADLTIITSKRETFSMPVAESLCCGTPVVGFNAGGPESIAMDEYCSFVDYGNVGELVNVVKMFLKNQYNKSEISNEATLIYDRDIMTSNYINIYKSL